MKTSKTTTQTTQAGRVTCGRCGGDGRLVAFSHVKGGVCFQCEGLGTVACGAAKYRRKTDPILFKKCDWLIASTPASFIGLSYERLSAMFEFAHKYGSNRELYDTYGETVYEAFRNQGGEAAFFKAQEAERRAMELIRETM